MILIRGCSVYLKSFTYDEYHELYRAYVADPVMESAEYVYDKQDVDARFIRITQNAVSYPRLGIFLNDDQIIGELSIKRICHNASRCEVGIALVNDDYKGHGYGTEAMNLAIEYIRNSLHIKHLYADTMGSNEAMKTILTKLGFQLKCIDVQYYEMPNRMEDRYNYLLIM